MSIPPEAAFPYPAAGTVIDGKYRCERMIGVGGMGAVAQATHLLRKAPVALKFMNPDIAARGGHVERFINEAVAASRIDSEHVVKIFDVGQLQDGTPFLVMEYLEGMDLAAVLEQDGVPGLGSIPRCLHFGVQILRGLQLAHDAGIIHRDMKPSNCFVIEKEGDPDFVKLLDFGISKLQQTDDVKLTQTNSMLGTPLYMAPEQARSAKFADLRSDLYAVGVILYELLTGAPPFYSADSFTELLLKIATAEPVPLTDLRPDVPPPLAAIVRRAFARDPNERYSSAFELSEALAPWCDDRSSAVIDAARRRATRVTGMPSTMLSPGEAAKPSAIPAGSAWPPAKTQVLAPEQSSHAGLATTASGAQARPSRRVVWGLAATGLIATTVVVGVVALSRTGSSSNGSSGLSSVGAEPLAPPTITAPPTPAEPSAAMVLVGDAPDAPVASVTPSATVPPAPEPIPTKNRPPREPKSGPATPRLGDITIKQ